MSATLDHLLIPFDPWLDDLGVEEICIQKPGEAWIFARGEWQRHAMPEIDATYVEDIAIIAGAQRRQDIWRDTPPLDTDLAGRGRINAIFPPIVADGQPCLTIRRGGDFWPTLEDQRKYGTFKRARDKMSKDTNRELVDLYKRAMTCEDDDERSLLLEQFFGEAVRVRLTALGVGVTASGKSTFLKSCVRAIPNPHERIVTVADTPEMIGLEKLYPNSVQLFYNRTETRFGMRAEDLIVTGLRMRPQWLIVQEVRDGPAGVAFVDGLMSGHDGMSTLHAESCNEAFIRLKQIYEKNSGQISIEQLKKLLDVVVHFTSRTEADPEIRIDEIWFRECQE